MEALGLLPKIVILLLAAVCVVAFFKRLNLSPVLGYLVAGAAIGTHGLGYIDSEEFGLLGKFGIVFLLFAIGLELTVERLMAMRWHVFGFGTLQVLITAFVIGFVAYKFNLSVEASVIIGGSLAMSSTAIVLKVLNESNLQSTQVGRLALANLLLQDFAVVPLLVLVPLLADRSDGLALTLGKTTLNAFFAMIIIFFAGRMVLRPLFKLIASVKSSELFVAATLLVVLGTSLITEKLGLSLALGSFIAGLLVAETQYQHQVEESILPFKDLLMGLFFMTVGMTIDLEIIYKNLSLIAGLSIALISLKATIIAVLAKLFKFPTGSSIKAGLLLSQGGEFAFIVFGYASEEGRNLLSVNTAQILLLVVTITMAFTPILALIGRWISGTIDSARDNVEVEGVDSSEATDLNRHVIVIGYGRVGEMVSRLLSFKTVNFVVLDADKKRVKEGRDEGFPVIHGDAAKLESLRAVGIMRAKTVIITVNDLVYLKKVTRMINKICPDMPIVARAQDLRNAATLEKLGVTIIVPETYETGLQMAGALLKAVGVPEFEVSRIKNHFRANNYKWAKETIPLSSTTASDLEEVT